MLGFRLAEQRGGGGVRPGQGDRRRRPPWRAARPIAARSSAWSANGLDTPYPRINADLWESVARQGLLLSEWPPGTRAGAVPVPPTQPDPCRAERGRRGGREPRARRFADDGARGAGAVDRGDGRARVGEQPGCRRHQPADPRRRDAGHRRRRRAAGARSRPPACRTRATTHVRCRGATRPKVLARCRADPCTLDDVVADVGLPLAEAAMTLARLERSGWVREAGGWFEEVTPCAGSRSDGCRLGAVGVSAERVPPREYPRLDVRMLSPSRPTCSSSWRLESFARVVDLAVRQHGDGVPSPTYVASPTGRRGPASPIRPR